MFLVKKIRARLAICTSERHMLKGSYDVAKIALFGVMQCVYVV